MILMLTKEFIQQFSQEWIESWNSHDLDRILAHYSDDFEMTSPLIMSLMSIPSGTLKGKDKIREYWMKGLERRPALKFRLQKVTFGVDTVALHCDAETGRSFVECFFFADDTKVVKSFAHHDEISFAN
jgi:ketosteroid isomerase-like protein